MKIKVLDCTLRDGAHINKGLFQKENKVKILKGLIESKIDLIELGFLQDGEYSEDFTFYKNFENLEDSIKNIDKKESSFGLMLRTDRCDIAKIRKSEFIDFIRIAFYKEHLDDVKIYSKLLKDLGYKIYLNPIAISNYKKEEIIEIVNEMNDMLPDGVSIVDTFGALNINSFSKVLDLFNETLLKNIELGVHLHENLSLSLSLGIEATNKIKNRTLIIDSSLQGMGRMPGNLPTELICSYLNEENSEKYNIDLLIKLTDEYISQFKNINQWGYNPIYMNSAILNIDRTYPEYFNEKSFSFHENILLQKMIKQSNYGSKFDKKFANEIIEKFKS